MAKLQDMFTQARRSQGGGGIGFVSKSRPESKAHAAALVVRFAQVTAGSAEAALKAGADGLLFTWDGKNTDQLAALKAETEAAKAINERAVTGLLITGNVEKLDRDSLVRLKEQGVQYIILPFTAPARLLALENKDLEKVVTVPMRKDETYPLYIRNLTAFDGIAAVLLDFNLTGEVATMSIEDILDYRAVREAVRFPAFLSVRGDLSEADAYTLSTLGVQGVILTANDTSDAARQQIKALRELLEKIHQDEKDQEMPSLPNAQKSR